METSNKKTLKEWWSERTKSQKYMIIGLIVLFTVIGSFMDNNNKQSKASSDENSELKSSSSNSNKTTTHRCGRQWNGEKYAGGTYGNYCCEQCYADLYPN